MVGTLCILHSEQSSSGTFHSSRGVSQRQLAIRIPKYLTTFYGAFHYQIEYDGDLIQVFCPPSNHPETFDDIVYEMTTGFRLLVKTIGFLLEEHENYVNSKTRQKLALSPGYHSVFRNAVLVARKELVNTQWYLTKAGNAVRMLEGEMLEELDSLIKAQKGLRSGCGGDSLPSTRFLLDELGMHFTQLRGIKYCMRRYRTYIENQARLAIQNIDIGLKAIDCNILGESET